MVLICEEALLLEGIGKKTLNILFDQIKEKRKISITKFISLLNIPLVGEKTVKNLEINSYQEFINFNDSTFKSGQNIITWLKKNKEKAEKYFEFFEIENSFIAKTSVKNNKKVCLTGSWIKPRNELIKILSEKGYEVQTSVTTTTDILICEDPQAKSTKLQKAKQNGTKLVTYEEFFSTNN
jgi:NAD-dependent DNA ligase